jgi:Ca2+-binding EF-hand superfamily protein
MSLAPSPDASRVRASGTALARALAALSAGVSGAGAPAAGAAGSTRTERSLATLRSRADEARAQQLRGVFAAFDEDRDGLLSEAELASALLALGVDPTPRAVARFTAAATLPARGVDFAAFAAVNLAAAEGTPAALPRTRDAIVALFAEFDTARTGRVPLATLLHVLMEVQGATALSRDEANELLRHTGVLNAAAAADPRALYSMEVDYAAFVKHLEFAPLPAAPPKK